MMHLVTERSGGVRGDTCTCRQEGKWGGKKEGGGGGEWRNKGGRRKGGGTCRREKWCLLPDGVTHHFVQLIKT